jgi:hypothetical protein
MLRDVIKNKRCARLINMIILRLSLCIKSSSSTMYSSKDYPCLIESCAKKFGSKILFYFLVNETFKKKVTCK